MAKHKNSTNTGGPSLNRQRQQDSDEAVLLLVPGWDPYSPLPWDQVSQLIGTESLTAKGLLGHHPGCTFYPAGMLTPDVRMIGAMLAGYKKANIERILSGYVKDVKRSDAAKYLCCPLYIVGPNETISHADYHRLLDLHADPIGWRKMLRESKAARTTEHAFDKAISDALSETVVTCQVARDGLGLAGWQLDLAFESGLFTPGLPRHQVLAIEFQAAMAHPEKFLAALRAEENINAGQAAEALAIPRAHFDELVAAGRVKVHATGEFKWGTFALYRRGDVQDLLPEVPALTAARKAAQAARRQQASKKAVVTRQRTVAEVATARTSTQHQLAKKTRGRSLYEQALALVGFWGELVSAHADTYTGMANRARNPETSTRYRHIANDCYATKNELSALLARIHDPRVVWDFYDAGRLWLCDACREDAREMGMHPIEYVDYGSCNNCTIDHYYSVLGATITIDEPREITIPVPVALAWEGSSADAQPRARKFGARPHEALPSWIRKIKSARNYSRYDLPVPRVTPAQLKAYPADVALEALSAAISSLRESLPGAILTA